MIFGLIWTIVAPTAEGMNSALKFVLFIAFICIMCLYGSAIVDGIYNATLVSLSCLADCLNSCLHFILSIVISTILSIVAFITNLMYLLLTIPAVLFVVFCINVIWKILYNGLFFNPHEKNFANITTSVTTFNRISNKLN